MIKLSQFIKSKKVIAHQRILTIVPREITHKNCPHWRQTAKAGFVPLRKAGPLFCSMRGPSSNHVSTFYWKMGNSECSHIIPVLSHVTVNNHASLLSSPDGESTPGNLQKDGLLKLPAGIHQNTTADIRSLFHQIFNKAGFGNQVRELWLYASLDHLRMLSANSQSAVMRMALLAYLLLHYFSVCFCSNPNKDM